MKEIQPRDGREKSTLSLAGKITAAAGVIGTAGVALAGAAGGMAWLADNLPLLVTGVTATASGLFTMYIAARRMKIDRGQK